jgi:phosphate/sulfate permease
MRKLGFTSVLTLILITLKLLDKIQISWVWVLSPLWGQFAILFILLFLAIIFERKKDNTTIVVKKSRFQEKLSKFK